MFKEFAPKMKGIYTKHKGFCLKKNKNKKARHADSLFSGNCDLLEENMFLKFYSLNGHKINFKLYSE
jgi:hypothetical protein